MPVDDFLLFIDANKYLDLYRTHEGNKLLAPLGEQVDYIFVTRQVFNEVQRNKLQVAANFWTEKCKELKLQTFGLPDHLSSTIINRNEIFQQMSDITQKIENVNENVDTLLLGIMEQISCSEDEVSKALAPIFDKATLPTPEELQRARDRRELGNPPGKIKDTLGDQLTWEQILTHFKEKGKKRLWIISRDNDFGTVYSGKGFLNQFLYDELCSIQPDLEVYLFGETVAGIKHFVDKTGVKAENRLKPEEVEEIEEEEKSLPSWSESNEETRRRLADVTNSLIWSQSLKSIPEFLIRSNEETERLMADILKIRDLMGSNGQTERLKTDILKPKDLE